MRHPTAEQRRAFFLPVILEAQRSVAAAAAAATSIAFPSLLQGREGEHPLLSPTAMRGTATELHQASGSAHPSGSRETVPSSSFHGGAEGRAAGPTPSLESAELTKARERERERDRERQAAEDAAAEHAFRRLRMCLRDVCYRVLRERRFEAFHFPMEVEEEEEYVAVVDRPVDVATLLQRVDARCYLCLEWFVEDLDLIPANVKVRVGEQVLPAR